MLTSSQNSRFDSYGKNLQRAILASIGLPICTGVAAQLQLEPLAWGLAASTTAAVATALLLYLNDPRPGPFQMATLRSRQGLEQDF